MYEVCEDAYKDGVRYIEVRFSPILHIQKGLTLSMVMEAVCEGQIVAELKLPGMIARIIVCGMRQMSSETSLSLAEIAWRYKSRGIVGFDLAGPEYGYSSRTHKEAFALIRKKLINCTLHSGEASDWKSVNDSIRFCGAQRIGHGVRMAQNEELVQFAVNKRIGVEVCLTSNLQTKAISKLSEHPVKDFFDRGMVIILCTDNMTVSGVSLSSEYEKAQDNFGFSLKDMVRILDFGFRSAFIEHALRHRIRLEAMTSTLKILEEEGYDISGLVSVRSHLNIGLEFPIVPLPHCQDTGDESLNSLYVERRNEWFNLIKKLPKSDNNTTLNGSISIDTLWELFENAKKDDFIIQQLKILHIDLEKGSLKTKEELRKLIQLDYHERHTKKTILFSIQLMSLFLQTKDQIGRGMEDIFQHAKEDNVVYFELFVRPTLHTKRGLSTHELVRFVLSKRDELVKKYAIKCNIILYVDNLEDGVEQMRQVAYLVVENKNKIAGFASFGINAEKVSYTHQEIEVFNFLKKYQINVSLSTGFKEARSVIAAINDGGATRLSGCFAIHTERQIMDYMARNRIPLEFGITDTLKHFFGVESEFITKKNKEEVVQLYIETGIQFTLCSFDLTLHRKTRSEMLFSLASYCKMDINQLLLLLYSGYKSSFANYWERVDLQETTYLQCLELLKSHNFKYSGKKMFFPS